MGGFISESNTENKIMHHSYYNILLLANNPYFKLLHICVKSICAVCDIQKIGKIYIADLGLRQEYREILIKLNGKIEIIDTNTNTGNSKKLYSKDWIDSVSQKTAILLTLIKNDHTPIVMLDSDTIITEDFSDFIDLNYDIQICKRASPVRRKDGFILEYIASFFIANNSKAEAFVTEWIKRLVKRINSKVLPPHETPAMIETLQNNTELKIGFLDENKVSCENNYIKGITKIIHAKSRNPNDSISIYRFANIKHLPYLKTVNLLNNSTEKLLFTIIYAFKKLFPLQDMKKMAKKALGKK